MDVTTKAGMKLIEQVTAKHYMSVLQMMENAGKACADYIQKKFPHHEYKNVMILCGHGANGGDGFVMARYLTRYDYNVEILFVGNEQKMVTETFTNYKKCQDLHVKMHYFDIETAEPISPTQSEPYLEMGYNIIIDAVYGTGFRGTINDALFSVFTRIFSQRTLKIAIDMPSGLDADKGNIHLECKKDHLYPKYNITFTLGYPKIGLYLSNAPIYRGVVVNLDIGLPKLQKLFEYEPELESQLSKEIFKLRYPQKLYKLNHRFRTSHKGDYGRVGIIGGSRGFTGAAILSSRACVACGAGLTSLYHQPGLEVIFATTLVEVMTRGLDIHNPEDIAHLLNNDILLIGPGLGKSQWALEVLTFVIDNYGDKPIFFDADAINLLAENHDLLEKLKTRNHIYLTPHMGEFSRLANITIDEINDQPFQALSEFCHKYGVSILLKNHYCIFYNHLEDHKSQTLLIGGHDGLSKGGTGDVLAGMLVSLFIQKTLAQKKAEVNPADININISNIFYIIVQYFYYIADKLSETYETPAITPIMIIDSIFRRSGERGEE